MSNLNLFSEEWSEKLKRAGMAQAADNGKRDLDIAREVAAGIGRAYGVCNIDLVNKAINREYGITSLGGAAGSVFKGKEWKPTGTYVKTTKITSHRRPVMVWGWVGE